MSFTRASRAPLIPLGEKGGNEPKMECANATAGLWHHRPGHQVAWSPSRLVQGRVLLLCSSARVRTRSGTSSPPLLTISIAKNAFRKTVSSSSACREDRCRIGNLVQTRFAPTVVVMGTVPLAVVPLNSRGDRTGDSPHSNRHSPRTAQSRSRHHQEEIRACERTMCRRQTGCENGR